MDLSVLLACFCTPFTSQLCQMLQHMFEHPININFFEHFVVTKVFKCMHRCIGPDTITKRNNLVLMQVNLLCLLRIPKKCSLRLMNFSPIGHYKIKHYSSDTTCMQLQLKKLLLYGYFCSVLTKEDNDNPYQRIVPDGDGAYYCYRRWSH